MDNFPSGDSDDSLEEEQPPPSIRFGPFSNPALGFPLIIMGVLFLAVNGLLERQSLESQPWYGAVWSADGEAPWENTIPMQARRVPQENFPDLTKALNTYRENLQENQAEQFESMVSNMGLERTEPVLFLELDDAQWESLLESGRAPVPGEPEVLAGVFSRLESFRMDDVEFQVVGRLSSSVAGMHFAYLLPRSETFASLFAGEDATSGWLDPEGRERLNNGDGDDDVLKEQDIQGGQVPTTAGRSLGSIFGLILVAVGGAIAHVGIFRVLASRGRSLLSTGLYAVLEQPRLFFAMHVWLYGAFFGMMLVGISAPVVQMWLQNFITHEFTEGGLSYVGQAYASQQIFAAAGATWFNNFIVQTVGMTFIISFIVPMLGVLKTLASFLVVGFGMAPLWSGMAWMFSFHSITMTLELEAYIVACTIVVFFWRRVASGIMNKDLAVQAQIGFRAVNSGVVLTGLMLGFAALYEATSLILLR